MQDASGAENKLKPKRNRRVRKPKRRPNEEMPEPDVDETSIIGPGDEYNARDDFNKSINACYEAIRERMKNGGPGFDPDRLPPDRRK